MGPHSASAPARRCAPPAWIAPLLLALLALLVLLPAAGLADDGPGRWNLNDRDGRRWSLSLFAQPDPAYPGGNRLRLTSLAAGGEAASTPSHTAALELADAFAGRWLLPNRSEELVAPGGEPPQQSAQFSLDPVTADLRAEGPVVLAVPLSDGGQATIVLGPEIATSLQGMASGGS